MKKNLFIITTLGLALMVSFASSAVAAVVKSDPSTQAHCKLQRNSNKIGSRSFAAVTTAKPSFHSTKGYNSKQ